MYIVYVHDAKIGKENGLSLQFCSNYPPILSRNVAMYIFLTNYNTMQSRIYLNKGISTKIKTTIIQCKKMNRKRISIEQ